MSFCLKLLSHNLTSFTLTAFFFLIQFDIKTEFAVMIGILNSTASLCIQKTVIVKDLAVVMNTVIKSVGCIPLLNNSPDFNLEKPASAM